jgi:subtilase family serine protease
MPSTNMQEFDSSHLEAPSWANRLGDTPSDEVITVSVYLKPHPNSLGVANPANPHERRAALHDQRSADYQDDIRLIENFASENGLTVTEVDPGRLLVRLSGTVAKFEAAFRTKLHTYEHQGRKFRGREGFLCRRN